jgi:alanyl-tRNA synthetase
LLASKLSTDPATVALLASTQQEPASVFIARGAGPKFSCGELMKNALAARGLRGGGSPSLAQGQIERASLDSLLDELEAATRMASAAPSV